MQYSLFHLNMWMGAYLDEILATIKTNNYDILHIQEIAGGSISKTGRDCFEEIKALGYEGVLLPTTREIGHPDSYFGNATFFKPTFTLREHKFVWMHPYKELNSIKDRPYEDHPRAAIISLLENEGECFWTINTHMVWGPTPEDKDYKMVQGKILRDAVSVLTGSKILTGDFNHTADTNLVKLFDDVGQNYTSKNNIPNTLNPDVHYAKHLFPPGVAVDMVFATPDIKVTDFKVLTDKLSDHYALSFKFEL